MPLPRDIQVQQNKDRLARMAEQDQRNEEAVKTLEEQREEAIRNREALTQARAAQHGKDGGSASKAEGDGLDSAGVFPSVRDEGGLTNVKNAGGPAENKALKTASKSGKRK